MKTRTAIAVASLLMPLGAAAQIGPVGGEFQVNSYTPGYQRFPAMASGADGSFVVAWTSFQEQDGSMEGVFAQRYNSAGQAVGVEFQVNSSTTGYQRNPAVAASADGAFVVAWWGAGQVGSASGVFGQRYDSAGQAVDTEFRVNTDTASSQYGPAVAAEADGAFAVAWNSFGQDGSSWGVFAQRYDSTGQAMGLEFQVNSYTTSLQRHPAVASRGNGAFVVVWDSYTQDDSSYGVFGQRYDGMGQAVGSEFQVSHHTRGSQTFPTVAARADGAFVVAWNSKGQDGGYGGVFAQRYDSGGQAVGSEFQVNTYTTFNQRFSAVAAGADGAFAVAWETYQQDGGNWGVFGQRYDSAGQTVGPEFQVNGSTTFNQRDPKVAAGPGGALVVAWTGPRGQAGDFGVFAQRFAVLPPCAGDCDRDGTLSIDELITGVAAALELLPIDDCPAFDADKSGQITIDELVAAVDAALHGCTD